MQNMVLVRKNNAYFVGKIFFVFLLTFRALGVESPCGEAMNGGGCGK